MENKISVIIPVFNCERYIMDAIRSVLRQTYKNLEIIVIDDGSTDGTAVIVKETLPKIIYDFQPHAGLGAARNKGVSLAKGEFFAFLDADDIWLEDKLMRQMETFYRQPHLDMVFGHVEQFYTVPSKSKTDGPGNNIKKIAGYFAGSMLIRRESFFRAGPFATGWRVGEFIDWYLKALALGLQTALLPEVVMKRRIHDANMGIRHYDARNDYVRIIKYHLERQRK